MAKRTIVYIDGFNLYYGALKGTSHKWLNLQKYFKLLLPHDDLREVCYFTSEVSGRPRADQQAYLAALTTQPLISIHYGKFKTKKVKCAVPCTYAGDRWFQVMEEKRTDVNIAVRLVEDAYQDVCDKFVIVSGDSDLAPALHCIQRRCPEKRRVVYIPALDPIRGAAVEMRGAANQNRLLPINLMPRCQFPATVPDGSGKMISKPAGW